MKFVLAFFTLQALLGTAEGDGIRGNEENRRLQGMGNEDRTQGFLEPIVSGLLPGRDRPNILLAMGTDYAPYAQLGSAKDGLPLSGFAYDFATAMPNMCDLDMSVMETQWDRCFGSNQIGDGLRSGEFHGCMTYKQSSGVRSRYLEFSKSILQDDNDKGALLTRLNADGTPVVDGSSNLNEVKTIDVDGWSPQTEELALSSNLCTGESFTNYTFVTPSTSTGIANDDALRALLDGEGDALWISAGDPESFMCSNANVTGAEPTWDCALWDGLGTTYAYVQTGLPVGVRSGTTLSISKKGSKLSSILDPCIEKMLQTETYYEMCVKWGLTKDCIPNGFFGDLGIDAEPKKTPSDALSLIPTNELNSTCGDGYCSCPAR